MVPGAEGWGPGKARMNCLECFLPALNSTCEAAEVEGSVCPDSPTLSLRDTKQNANERERDATTTGLRLSSKVSATVMPEGFWLLGRNLWPPSQLLVLGDQ